MKYRLIRWDNCSLSQKFFRVLFSLMTTLAVFMITIYLNGYSTPSIAQNSRPLRGLKTTNLAIAKEEVLEEEIIEEEILEEEILEEEPIIIDEYYSDPEETFEETCFTDGDIEILAKTLYGEANCVDDVGKAMVVWCILNRYDSDLFGSSITEICTAPYQFEGYHPDYPVTDENLAIIYSVIYEWECEKIGYDVNRVLPSDYLYFVADSVPEIGYWHNAFYKYTNVVSGDVVYY